MFTSTTAAEKQTAARTRGRRLRALWLGLLTTAACIDHDITPIAPAAAAVASVAQSALAAQPQTGIECGCSRVGPYSAPDPGKTIATGRDGASPGNVYQLSVSTIGNTISLRIMRGTVLVKQFSGLPMTTSWGFSPDDQRFVYHYLTGSAPNQLHNVYMYNLAASGAPLVRSFQAATGASRIVFSPRGRHLLYASVTGRTTSLVVVDAVTGATRYQTAFAFQVPPGSPGDQFGMASWGFSPDASDRTFAYVYITGQNLAQWNVVNLALPASTALVRSESAGTGFWRFSPCGDVLGVVRQPSQAQLWAYLVRTLDGSVVTNSGRTLSLGTVVFNATPANHIVNLNGVDQPALAANTADDACQVPLPPPTLTALTLNRSSVQGGGTATGTVSLSGAAPAAGVVVTLSSSNAGAATVPANVSVPSGRNSATFTVQTSPVTTSTAVTISAAAGGVTRTAPLTVTAPPPPVRTISLDPGNLSFGNQPVATTSAPQGVILSNRGTLPVTIGGIATGGDFGLSHNCPVSPATLPVATSCTIFVTFTPTTTGPRSGQVSVSSDATGNPHFVGLSGNGYVPVPAATVSSTSLNFGSVRLGLSPSRRSLTLTSTGTATLMVSTVNIGGAHPNDFYIDSDNCSGSALSPGSSCTVSIFFDPTRAGTRTAAITIAHNGQGGPNVVAMSGTGVPIVGPQP